MITFLGCLGLLVAAYFTYGRYLERLCGVDAARPVPSATSFDGVDYIPMPMWRTFLIQLLNIAGLGPIFGAVLGAGVRALQEMLNALAYGLDADGIFGKATEAAVRDFQKINGLSVDGIVGAQTWAALEGAKDSTDSDTYTVTIRGLDAATAAYLLECYPGAASAEGGRG